MIWFPGKRALRRTLGAANWQHARCLFVLSTGRVGTVTLMHLLRLSNQVRAWHEPEPQLIAEAKAAHAGLAKDRVAFQRIFRDAKAVEIGIAVVRKRIYAETSNRLTFFAPAIAEALPGARFLHLYRHPAEVVRSGMRRGWYLNNEFDVHRIEPLPDDEAYDRWSGWDAFSKNCWNWQAVNRFALDFQESIEPRRFLAISSEELIQSSRGSYARIFDFLSIPAPSRERAESVLSQRYNLQKEGDFPRYCDWDERQRAILEQIAGPVAQRLGYVLSAGSRSAAPHGAVARAAGA
ncbi:MAG: sulfotransferase [Pirellulales bacterium]